MIDMMIDIVIGKPEYECAEEDVHSGARFGLFVECSDSRTNHDGANERRHAAADVNNS